MITARKLIVYHFTMSALQVKLCIETTADIRTAISLLDRANLQLHNTVLP